VTRNHARDVLITSRIRVSAREWDAANRQASAAVSGEVAEWVALP
jgi:hypothetical protein